MMWLFLVLWIMTVILLIAAFVRIADVQKEVCDEKTAHESCHEATLAVLSTASKRTDASALRAAADRWDSIEEQGNLKRLASERYKPGGPSMPTIWLRAEADRMDPALEGVGN